MTSLGRRVLVWMIPLHLLLVCWVWFGRFFFGVSGWFLLVYAVSIVPALLAGLLVTTVLSFLQPVRPRALTRGQARAQLVVWAGMFGFGLFSLDFGDTPEATRSLLTQLFGPSEALLDLSWALMLVFAALTVVAWLVLLVTLAAGRRREPAATAARGS